MLDAPSRALTDRLVDLSETMGLTFPETVALPTVVQVFARRVNLSDAAMVVELERNAELRAYAKTMCAEGAKAL